MAPNRALMGARCPSPPLGHGRCFRRGALPPLTPFPCCRYIRCQKEVGKSFERHKLKRQDADAW